MRDGRALCDRNDAVSLSLRFLDVALLVGERLVGVPLRGNQGSGTCTSTRLTVVTVMPVL